MSSRAPVTIEFELTPEDWAEVCVAHSLASPITQKGMRHARLVFVAICALLGLSQVLTVVYKKPKSSHCT